MFCSWLHDTWASTAKSNKSVQTLQKNLARKIAEINLPLGGVKTVQQKWWFWSSGGKQDNTLCHDHPN